MTPEPFHFTDALLTVVSTGILGFAIWSTKLLWRLDTRLAVIEAVLGIRRDGVIQRHEGD